MTLKEFFQKARRRKWRLVEGINGSWNHVPLVRCANGMCPLRAIGGSWVPRYAAKTLGIPVRLAWKIAKGADFPNSPHRKWLLKNLGVSHTPTPEPPQ